MTRKKISLKQNYLFSTIYQIIVLIIPFITAPYTARIFSADGIGIQSYANSIVAYFTIFAALGTSIYGQREISACQDNVEKSSKLFWEIELLSIISTGVCMIGWMILILCSKQYKPYYLALTMTLIAVAFDISWFYMGKENFRLIAIRNIVIRVVGLICLFIFVKSKNDLLLYIALTASVGLIGSVSMWFSLPNYLIKVKIRDLHVRHHLRETLIYFVPTLALSIYTVMDKTMIGIITKNSFENGYYEQAQKIVTIVKALILSLNTVMSSRMSYLFTNNKMDEMKNNIKKSLDFTLVLGIPMTIGLICVSRTLIPVFLGAGYEKSIYLLEMCSLLIVITAISNLAGHQYLIPSGQRARSSKVVIIGAVINFTLNLILIPHFESYGATIASVIAETVITILYVRMCGGFLDFKLIIKSGYKRVIIGLFMALGIYVISNYISTSVLSLLLQIIVGAFIYVVGLLIIKDEFIYAFLQELRSRQN